MKSPFLSRTKTDIIQLAAIPADVAHYGGRVADYIEKHTSNLASEIRDAIDSATWIPESIKPPRSHGGPHHFFHRAPPPPKGWYEQSVDFVSKNRTTIAIVVAFAGTTAYLVHRRKKEHARKRRAKKLPNGAKKEIVVLACSTFHDPLTRSLALDLERRGYVVYVTVSSTEEDSLIQQEAKTDLRPLWIDLTSTVINPETDTHPNLEPIKELLTKLSNSQSPSSPSRYSGSSLSNMTLAGVILFPGCSGYPTGTLTTLHPSDIVDSINTRLLSPILTIQQFLPLLTRHSTDPKSPSSIIIAYPSIPQSLSPPTQIPETIITTSLSSLASSLRREVRASNNNVTITELKLGNFDLGSISHSKTLHRSYHNNNNTNNTNTSSNTSSQLTLTHVPTTHWHSSQRAAIQRSTFGQSSLIKGSPAREFHNAVFDALAPAQVFRPFGRFEYTSRKTSEVRFVGQGARLYDVVGRVVPAGLVAFMMGYRRRRDEQALRDRFFADLEKNENDGGSATGTGTRSKDGSADPTPAASGLWADQSLNLNSSESAVWEKV